MTLTPFEQAYLSYLKRRKERGLALKRPKMESKTRLFPTAQMHDYAKWLERVFSFPISGFMQMAKEKSKIFLTDHRDEEGDEGIWAIFGSELYEYQNSLLNGQLPLISAALVGFGSEIHAFGDKQWQKFAEASIGQVWNSEDLWAEPLLETWRNEQISLIGSVGTKQAETVASIVSEGVRNGRHMRDIASDLEVALQGISMNKSRLIARDQVGKLYGMITKEEDTSAGIQEYDWSSSHDERVRGNPNGKYKKAIPSHWLIHGKTCLWSDPTVWWAGDAFVPRDARAPMVHPGMAIQCRCVSIPRVDLMFDRLEAMLK